MLPDASRTPRIHILEPTLQGYSGHCYSLVRSFCDSAADRKITIWAGRRAARLQFAASATVRPFFYRRLRVVQLAWLLHRLLREDGRVVVLTARRSDLALAHVMAGRRISPGKLFFYFHWFRETPARIAFLREMARSQPNVTIAATTESVAKLFSDTGFRDVFYLPYPLTSKPAQGSRTQEFTHLLFAGAARQDKGFTHIVALVERLVERAIQWPVIVQVSADHYGKHDDKTRADIARLRRCDSSRLRTIEQPLSPDDYSALFPGGICLQPYDRDDFRDRVSGVTLDALSHGCPAIVPAGTWMANVVSSYSAGVVLHDFNPDAMIDAVRRLIAEFENYQQNALAAGAALRARFWEPLFTRFDLQ